MKKKGSKKKVNSHNSSNKKQKKFFFFFAKNKVAPVVLAFVFLALVILLPFFTTGNAVNSTVTGKASFLDDPASVKIPSLLNWLNLGNTWREIIVFIIVFLILFAMLFDILTLVSIFSGWVSFIIALGMSIVAALIDLVRQISVLFITAGALLGIAAGFVEIGVGIVIFVGLTFASSRIAIWAAKRKAQKEELKAIKGAGQAGGAITGLKMIQKDFRHNA